LSKWQLFIKSQLAEWYGNWLHDGQYLEPAMRDIEQLFINSQKNVTGEVNIKLIPYTFQIQGINSEYDLMNNSFGKYGEENNFWTSNDAKGFAKILSNSSAIYSIINKPIIE
jgi:argininosuccinate synthase